MIHSDRMTGRRDGEFAVLLIGMRFNRPPAKAGLQSAAGRLHPER
jgi:hypothetical protein